MFALLEYSMNPKTECKENLKTIHDTRGTECTGFMNIKNIYRQSERAKLYISLCLIKKENLKFKQWEESG